MKFSQLERNSFKVTKYTPGPGYYASEEANPVSSELKNVTSPPFSKIERFSDAYEDRTKIGPGYYKEKKSDFEKKFKENRGKTNKRQSNDFVRINVVPSIPSKNVKEGYEEIGNGLLVVMKGEKEDETCVGPGSYEPTYNFCKPRTASTIICSENTYSRSDKNKDDEQYNQKENGNYILGLASGAHVVDNSKKNKNQGQRFKSDLTSLISRDPHRSQVGEYNLELLMIRERQLAKDEGAPPPGKYFNEKLHTSFKIQDKLSEFQCFDSTAERFQEDNFTSINQTGPGEYNISQNWRAKEGITFGKKLRSISDVSHRTVYPGPGEYDARVVSEQLERGRNELFKMKQSHLIYCSAFGSGQVRFGGEKTEGIPGPGFYNLRKEYKKRKPRRVIMSQMAKDKQESRNQSAIIGESNLSINSIANISVKQKDIKEPIIKGNYVFKSQTKRFDEVQNASSMIEGWQNSELGPGSYEINSNILKDKQSHNKKNYLLNTTARELFKQPEKDERKLGPGYYEPQTELTKMKQPFLAFISS